MKSIAIITARGGSKRIPKKNIKLFCGRPIIEYSIESALKSNLFDTVMVSTDSEEIKEIAINAGAEVPFMRSESTSNDYATTGDVLKEVLRKFADNSEKYEVMACIYPTAPFANGLKLKKAYDILISSDVESVMPVVRFSYPPQRGNRIENGVLKYVYPEYIKCRSQDLEPIYHDAGQFYMYKVSDDLSFSLDRYAPLIVSDLEVQDIDNESDWAIAEMKYKLMKEKENKNEQL